jgi:hypothetical protein
MEVVVNRLLYEHSSICKGYLIIPFIYGGADQQTIYSYLLLSEQGHKGKFNKVENPAGLYSDQLDTILKIAQEHLAQASDIEQSSDYFKHRYIYQHHLIIVVQESGKYFYDHYPPQELNNIAAPKLFHTEHDCLTWIQQGLKRNYPDSTVRNHDLIS